MAGESGRVCGIGLKNRALKWAASYLIPEEELWYAVEKSGLTEVWELKDYFCVDEEMIDFRLRMLKKGVRN